MNKKELRAYLEREYENQCVDAMHELYGDDYINSKTLAPLTKKQLVEVQNHLDETYFALDKRAWAKYGDLPAVFQKQGRGNYYNLSRGDRLFAYEHYIDQ